MGVLLRESGHTVTLKGGQEFEIVACSGGWVFDFLAANTRTPSGAGRELAIDRFYSDYGRFADSRRTGCSDFF